MCERCEAIWADTAQPIREEMLKSQNASDAFRSELGSALSNSLVDLKVHPDENYSEEERKIAEEELEKCKPYISMMAAAAFAVGKAKLPPEMLIQISQIFSFGVALGGAAHHIENPEPAPADVTKH